MKKIIEVLISVLIIIVIIVNVIFIFNKLILKQDLPKLFGYSQAVVLSDSMYPIFKKGDLVIFKEGVYNEDDIIIFKKNNIFITHRIIECDDGEFITKGDNNPSVDRDLVSENEIEGKFVLVIPYLGSIINFLTSIYGIILLFIILIVSTYFKNKKLVLLFLLIPSSFTFALFETTLFGSDSAMVANVYMDLVLDEISLSNLVPGEVEKIAFSVINYDNDFVSEVKQEYEIVIKKTENILVDVRLNVVEPLDNGKYVDELVINNASYTYVNGVLDTSKEAHHYILELEVLQNTKNKTYYEEIDIVFLEVNSVQKNS